MFLKGYIDLIHVYAVHKLTPEGSELDGLLRTNKFLDTTTLGSRKKRVHCKLHDKYEA